MPSELRRMDDAEIASLKATVSQWMKSTDEFRDELRQDIKDLNAKLAMLPCVKGHDATVDKQLSGLWWIVGVGLISIVGLGVAWGAANKQVEINTTRWERYLEGHENGKRGLGMSDV